MADATTEWYKDPATIRTIYELAITRGLIVKPSVEIIDSSAALSICVLATPSYFPRELYSLGNDVQPGLNELIDAVSRHHDFLAGALENVVKVDSFTKKLYDIYNQTRHDNKQTCVLGIHRTDYMLDWQGSGRLALRQVEMNTIAAGMAGLSSRLKSFHEYVCSRYARRAVNVPDNTCLTSTVDAIAMAWAEYGSEDAVVMIITFPSENNLFDQRAVEFDLWQRHSIKCIRKTLNDVYHEATLGSGRDLIISGVKCAVAYFRAGYTPDDYPSEKEWQARLLIEKSTASCCPSVAYQLVGTKKLQQCLAAPGVLEQFLSDSKMIEKIRSTFAGLYSLDKTSEGDQAIEMALSDPERFVLKPQREGGGNNFYGDSLREKLSEVRNSSERTAYILMDRIQSPSQDGLVLRPKPHTLELEPEPVISEVGIFGMYVRRADRVLLNTSAGHLVRTKPLSANEGGVLMGTSALDSPSLLTTDEFISRIINQQ